MVPGMCDGERLGKYCGLGLGGGFCILGICVSGSEFSISTSRSGRPFDECLPNTTAGSSRADCGTTGRIQVLGKKTIGVWPQTPHHKV